MNICMRLGPFHVYGYSVADFGIRRSMRFIARVNKIPQIRTMALYKGNGEKMICECPPLS